MNTTTRAQRINKRHDAIWEQASRNRDRKILDNAPTEDLPLNDEEEAALEREMERERNSDPSGTLGEYETDAERNI